MTNIMQVFTHLFFMSRTSLFLVVSSSTCEAGEPTATGTAGLGGDTVKMVGPVAARERGMDGDLVHAYVCVYVHVLFAYVVCNGERFSDTLLFPSDLVTQPFLY